MTTSTRAPRLTRPKLLFAKSPKEVDALSKTALRGAERLLRKILSATGRRTVENALAPYNEIMMIAGEVQTQAPLLSTPHPRAAIRKEVCLVLHFADDH